MQEDAPFGATVRELTAAAKSGTDLNDPAGKVIQAAAAAGTYGYAIGEYLCPQCGGIASICVSTAEVLLICQGPGDLEAPDDDPRWDHAGQIVANLLATGYQPTGLN